MYKITLMDYNCPSCTSGTTRFFCDDIDIFEEKWSKLETSKERIERFKKSKSGILTTDFYQTDCDEKLNIVQEDKDAEILHEKHLAYHNKTLKLINGCCCESKFLVRDLDVHIRYIKFQDEYIKTASFIAKGICMVEDFGEEVKYYKVNCYGNPVLYATYDKDDLYVSNRRLDFDNDNIESFVFIPIKFFDSLEQMQHDFGSKRLSTRQRYILFMDILGDVG